MMLVARGLALQVTGAKAIGGLGDSFAELGNGALWRVVKVGTDGFPDVVFRGIPYPVLVMIVLAILVSIMLNRTTLGRHIYAVGSNAEAARLSGVNVTRRDVRLRAVRRARRPHRLRADVAPGDCPAERGRDVRARRDRGSVIGGTSLSGGVGSISGTGIGAFVIGILRNG
jgi:ribose transport system permease protein